MDGGATSYLAFDLGASSCRAVLGTLAGDRLDLEEIQRFRTPVISGATGLRWDIGEMENEMRRALRSAIIDTPRIRSISVDSWGVDYVGIGDDGEPAAMPYCYRDTRTDGIAAEVEATIGADALYAVTGIQSLPFNTLFQLVADRRAGFAPPFHLTMADWFNHRFGGEAVIDASLASTTQMMHADGPRRWADELMRRLELDPEAWPRIVPCGSVVGACSDHADVAVVASCSHDTGAAVAAVPAIGASGSWCFISCGTWSLMGVERSTPILAEEAREAGFTNEAGLDDTVRFLRNLTGLWVLQECVREWDGPLDWDTLEGEAIEAGPARAIVDLEHPRYLRPGGMQARLEHVLAEAGDPVPESRGAWVRMILESIANSYSCALAGLVELTGRPIDSIHLVGGGAQNHLLCRLAADACATRVIAGPAEATALGNCLIQARTMGDLPVGLSIRDLSAASSRCTSYEPST